MAGGGAAAGVFRGLAPSYIDGAGGSEGGEMGSRGLRSVAFVALAGLVALAGAGLLPVGL